ncbi:Aspartate carbamoyltransferase 1, chloroplastic [Sesamum angolense]|uniref:Large ribosomal subunit protein uL30m n=1 Tax=Sesamum angolense TaxID=2727404 RepID=A0AAE1W521_9LAMI|nr:Aspartate carbamoyltransferase 1, chloroplastic [Sesamum angolense]
MRRGDLSIGAVVEFSDNCTGPFHLVAVFTVFSLIWGADAASNGPKRTAKASVCAQVVHFAAMAASSTFSALTLKGTVLVPKASKSNPEFVCNYLDGSFKQKLHSMSVSASANTSHSWVFPYENTIDWRRGKLSLKSGVQCRALDVETKPSFSVGNKFELEDVIEGQQFDRDTLGAIFEVALEMEKIEKNSAGSQILKGYLMATLFYEPSTRTRLSFESAMKRLGGEVLTTENAREFSSAAKGETLEDTIRTVEGYADIIVMRHFESGAARRAAATANIPIINAGDGPGQHPTQALLDVYTIQREIGKLDGIKVGLVGDLAYGRTVRSLAYLLAKYKDVKIYFVSPEVVRMKRERFGERTDLYEEARGKYIVDRNVLDVMQKHAVVMHPLPRLDEITVVVDVDPRAAYFRQAKNGLYIRMALLKLLLLGRRKSTIRGTERIGGKMSAFNAFKANVPVAWSSNLYITLVRGIPGTRRLHRRTLEALRLTKCNRTVMRWNTPTVRGMLQQVKRLVVVETEEMYNARKQKEANHRALRPPLAVNHHPAPTSDASA